MQSKYWRDFLVQDFGLLVVFGDHYLCLELPRQRGKFYRFLSLFSLNLLSALWSRARDALGKAIAWMEDPREPKIRCADSDRRMTPNFFAPARPENQIVRELE